MKLSAKQEVLFAEPFFELIVICSTSANFDQTVKTFSPAIQKSKLIAVKDTELLDWLNKGASSLSNILIIILSKKIQLIILC